MKRYKRHDLVVVKLNKNQIGKAKKAHAKHEKITHVLLCGPYGQLFGTEDFCTKRAITWLEVFPYIFKKRKKISRAKLSNYESTWDLVGTLITVQDGLSAQYGVQPPPPQFKKQSGCCLLPFRRK